MLKTRYTVDNISKMIDTWGGSTLVKNLRLYESKGLLTVDLPDADLSEDQWDGTLVVEFKRKPTADEVVNHFVGPARADYVNMEGKKLTLWWD